MANKLEEPKTVLH